jgi:nucleoside-diphosphate-sugar epimerase
MSDEHEPDRERRLTFPWIPGAPISPYGASKAAAETYLALYRRLHGLSTCALRLANVYGPRQDPLGEGGVVAIYCHAAATGKAVRVFGDGRQTRDFVYVGDVAAAAGESDVSGPLQHRNGARDERGRAGRAAWARAALWPHRPLEPVSQAT